MHNLSVEYMAMGRQYGEVQRRCSELILDQQAQIQALEARAMRLRGEVILRVTALEVERQGHLQLKQQLKAIAAGFADEPAQQTEHQVSVSALDCDRLDGLDSNLAAADLVICQTGCVSHGAYWRVQDHCQRTGKSCVLVAQPDALRILRIHWQQRELAGLV